MFFFSVHSESGFAEFFPSAEPLPRQNLRNFFRNRLYIYNEAIAQSKRKFLLSPKAIRLSGDPKYLRNKTAKLFM